MDMRDAVISFPMFGESFHFDPSPNINVFGRDIYWYGIIIACGFLLAVAYGMRRTKDFGVTQDNLLDMLLVSVPLAIVGARLYYVIFNPGNYFGPGKWGNIVKIWEGGLAIYGGVIGAVIGLVIICKARKIPIKPMLDIGGLGLLIGQAIGRWGNFMNREAFGSVTDVFCRMGLTLPGKETVYVHPTFLYESLWNVVGFFILHYVSKKHRKFDGQIFIMYLGWYGLGRFFIEGLRTDSLYIGHTDIRVSQLLALICFGLAVTFLIKYFVDKRGSFPMLQSEIAAQKAAEHATENAPENTSDAETITNTGDNADENMKQE